MRPHLPFSPLLFLILFIALLAGALSIAHLRQSGSTGIDMSLLQKIRIEATSSPHPS